MKYLAKVIVYPLIAIIVITIVIIDKVITPPIVWLLNKAME